MASRKPKPKSLNDTHPKIAALADGWDPKTLRAGSNECVQWKCELGHVWKKIIYSQVENNNCPVCSNKKVCAGFNDVGTTHPDLVEQAVDWNPSEYLANSHKRQNWKCNQGHNWVASIAERALRGFGCPYCSGKRALPGFNDLATTHPELAKEADGWDPKSFRPGSNKKLKWKCSEEHRWEMAIVDRTGQNQGCPYCSGRRVLVGFNDLRTIAPHLAAEADGWDPTTVTKGSQKEFAWKCKLGHKWNTSVGSRTSGRGCPVCSGNVVAVGVNDLKTVRPEIASEADGWDPTTVTEFSTFKGKWKCELGHQWEAQVSNRTAGLTGCPICAGQELLVGFNDLATTHPELAKQADGWDPKFERASRHVKRNWHGPCGHRWGANVSARAYQGDSCVYCSGKRVLPGFNDLKTVKPKIASEADGWDPTSVTSQSGKFMNWRCDKGHAYRAKIAQRVGNDNKQGTSCPYCSGAKVLTGFNDLSTINPDLAAQAFGWDPSVYTKGSHARVKWICKEKHVWTSSIHDRNSGSGCPSCAKGGFDPNQPGYLYLIDHFDLQMFQIGITNFPENRLGDHTRRGWEVIELRGPMDGHLTQQLETSSLRTLEKHGAILGHKASIEKFDGYSEAWTKKSLNVTSIKQILDWVYEDEAK